MASASATASSAVRFVQPVYGPNIAALGTWDLFVPSPTGGGNPSPETMRNGVKPPEGTTDYSLQFDTFNGGGARANDWFGMTFASAKNFGKLGFQQGGMFVDGGWFTSLNVQVRIASVWTNVSSELWTPSYGFASEVGWRAHYITFTAVSGDGIRIYGVPGGSAKFTACAEFEVYEYL